MRTIRERTNHGFPRRQVGRALELKSLIDAKAAQPGTKSWGRPVGKTPIVGDRVVAITRSPVNDAVDAQRHEGSDRNVPQHSEHD